uniref:Trafficking protein particle complex subunit 8 n=1 Tax=Schizaphis graminum TaxID=13262 RepID=A0A2S2NGE0_SCHGA
MACDDDDDFVRGIFCPHVAVLCSDKAQEMCRKNNLNFSDLLNPFARLTDVNFKDTNGSTINVPNLQIKFSNINSQPLSVTKERSRLHNSVNVTTEPSNITVKIGND